MKYADLFSEEDLNDSEKNTQGEKINVQNSQDKLINICKINNDQYLNIPNNFIEDNLLYEQIDNQDLQYKQILYNS